MRAASLLLLFLPAFASAHVVEPREDLDAIFVSASAVVRGEVLQVVTPFGSAGPTEVSLLVQDVLKGETPAALTFAASEEHGSRWVVGDRGFFFLRPNQGRGPSWASVALRGESPTYVGREWKPIQSWLLARGKPRSPALFDSALASPADPIRRHAEWLRKKEGRPAERGGIFSAWLLVGASLCLGALGLTALRLRRS